MAKRVLAKLSARSVATLGRGRHSDGGGLYLAVSDDGRRRWIFRYTLYGRIREMGLGSTRDVSLAIARDRADEARRKVRDGIDPIGSRDDEAIAAARGTRTFGEVADEFIEKFENGWRNTKHRAQWAMTLNVYAAAIRDRPVASISTADVMTVLNPIWNRRPETASRLRGRLERVLDYAKVNGLREGENPARWRGHLDKLLPRPAKLVRGHHKALAFDDNSMFFALLREKPTLSARAMELTILTCLRTEEVIGARWDEFDLERAIWVVPGVRMKTKREHRVPLSPPAIALLEKLREASNSPFVFPGQVRRAKEATSMSSGAMAQALKRWGVTDATIHGFRSSFRDWGAERTDYSNEFLEAALAHTIQNRVEAAYRRGDLFEKRRELMISWGHWCSGNDQ